MSNSKEKLSITESLEVIEGLLDIIVQRERQISQLAMRLEALEDKYGPQECKDPASKAKQREECSILVADESKIMLRRLQRFLLDSGFKVVGTERSGLEVIHKFRKSKPDIVILDLKLTGVNGVHVIKELKLIRPDAKVIILSSSLDKDTIIQLVQFGATDYLVKPVQPTRLLQLIQDLVA